MTERKISDTVFDVDDCSYGWYVMDIAMGLFDVLVLYPGEEKVAFAEQFIRDYLHGYMAKTKSGHSGSASSLTS